MTKRQTAGKAAPAAAATAEQQGSLPAGVSQEAAAAAAALDNGQQIAAAIASPGTPGADAIALGAGINLQPTVSAAANPAATLGMELPGATQGQDAHLGSQAGGDAPVPGAASQLMAGTGTPGADAIALGAGINLQPTVSAAANPAATLGMELPGATQGQDAHLGSQAGGDAPVPGAASQLMAGTGASELGDEIQGLFVRSVPESFRRCGYRFTREGFGIALSALTDDEIDALCSDPNLVVEHCTFSDTDLS